MKRVAKTGAPYGAGRAARALWVYSVENKIHRGYLPFFLLERTERGSQVKPLRFVPTAGGAQQSRGLDPTPSALLYCFQLGKIGLKNGTPRRYPDKTPETSILLGCLNDQHSFMSPRTSARTCTQIA
ncbi:MAG TPA: hypothetical protein VH596_07845 [Terriglobales bacterium]